MKKKLFALLLVAICVISCQNGIWDAIHDLEDKYTDLDGRVAKLEELCKEMNTNISSLQTLVSVILTNDYIISTTPITKDGKEIGYTITFAIHEPITIYHGQNGKDGANGKDGKDGKNGENGTNGQDGKDGADGITPIIGVAQDETDHAYYWTLNGEWLLDANGNRIPLTSRDGINGQDGQDGKDGKDGINGQDGITPRLKIENGYWFISYDNGVTWMQLGKAVGENGQDGKDGKDGQDGEKGDKGDQGEPGYSMFTEVTQDDEFVYFTLYNGTVLTVRKGNSTFDQTIIDNLVTSLTLDRKVLYLEHIGDRDTLIASTLPFKESKVTWSTDNPEIISVDKGVVSAVGIGFTRVYASAGDKSTYIDVYVYKNNVYSVSPTQKISFSCGDLIYTEEGSHICADETSKPGVWSFANNQYDLGSLLYYGNSGYGEDVIMNQRSIYWPPFLAGCYSGVSVDISGTWYDYGKYNAINNGGNQPGIWRMLSQSEYIYICNNRDNASKLKGSIILNYNNENISYRYLLPDDWASIVENPLVSQNLEYHIRNYIDNGGIIFRESKWISGPGKVTNVANYSAYLTYGAPCMSANSSTAMGGNNSTYSSSSTRMSVRLVKDLE